MSKAISVFHGNFGRATLYHLDRPIIPHAHREGHLLFHVHGGHGRIRIEGQENAITPATAVAVNPWELHGYAPNRAEGQYIVVLYIRPSWFHGHRQEQSLGLRFGASEFAVTPEVGAWVTQLADLLSNGGGSNEQFEALLYQLTHACYQLSHHTPHERQARVERFEANDFRVRKSLRLMSERLDCDLDVARLASDSGLSRPHFFKLFRSQIGVPPKLFWNTLRLERAYHDLVETPKPICDISFELGFSSQSSFSRFFCLNTGMAPTDYRRVGHVVPN